MSRNLRIAIYVSIAIHMLRKLARKLSVSTSPAGRKWRQGTSRSHSTISGQHSKLEYDCIVDDLNYYTKTRKAVSGNDRKRARKMYEKYIVLQDAADYGKYAAGRYVNTIRANLK